VVGQWGWQAGFWVASAALILKGIHLLVTYPRDVKIEKVVRVKTQLRRTLSAPIVLSGVSLGLLNMVRYGVITWIPLFFFERSGYGVEQIGKVGLKVFLIPVAGILGTLVYNAFKRVSKDILSVICLVCLAVTLFLLPGTTGLMTVAILLIGSFFLYGPHVFLVTTCPTRFHDQKVVAASTGFIDGMGYVGTVLIGIIVPFILTQFGNNWNIVFYFWGVLAVAIAGLTLFTKIRYFKRD